MTERDARLGEVHAALMALEAKKRAEVPARTRMSVLLALIGLALVLAGIGVAIVNGDSAPTWGGFALVAVGVWLCSRLPRGA